jgi:hypothetical protein
MPRGQWEQKKKSEVPKKGEERKRSEKEIDGVEWGQQHYQQQYQQENKTKERD